MSIRKNNTQYAPSDPVVRARQTAVFSIRKYLGSGPIDLIHSALSQLCSEQTGRRRQPSGFQACLTHAEGDCDSARRVCSGGPACGQSMLDKAISLVLRLLSRIRTLLNKQNCMILVSPDPRRARPVHVGLLCCHGRRHGHSARLRTGRSVSWTNASSGCADARMYRHASRHASFYGQVLPFSFKTGI